MRRIFGKGKEKPPPPSLEDTSGQLSQRGETIDEKIKKLDAELMRHRDAIKKARPGPAQEAAKQRAMKVLKQKKLYESQRDQLYSQQFNLDQVAFTAESLKATTQQVQAMKVATKDLKTQFKSKDLDIDAIEDMQDEMADMMDQANEINDALARNYNVPDDIDEEELLGELDALELDMANEEAGAVPSYLQDEEEKVPDLPTAPEGVPQAPQPVAPPPEQLPALQTDEYGLPVAQQRAA